MSEEKRGSKTPRQKPALAEASGGAPGPGRSLRILLALFLLFGGRLLPPFSGLSQSGVQVLSIFLGVLLLWLTVAIDWPSVLVLGALGLVPDLSFSQVLAWAYGSSTFAFLIYTFVVSYALAKTSYIRRIALAFISSKWAAKGPWAFVSLYFASILFLGSFLSPTVLFFVYLPILEELCALLGLQKGHPFASMLMLGTVFFCGISSGMTPIAHVFPIVAMSAYQTAYGQAISYGAYLAMAIPVGLVTSLLLLLVFRFVLKPDLSSFRKFSREKLPRLAPPSRSEKATLVIFLLVLGLWILPSLTKGFFAGSPLGSLLTKLDRLGTAFPPLVGLSLLSIWTVEGKPLLPFSEAMREGVSWPSVILCAATMALGSAITKPEIGLTAWLSAKVSPLTESLPPLLLVLFFCFWAALETNLSSNLVTASVVSAAALAVTSGMAQIKLAALIVLIGMLSAYAFATPPAMPSVAIAAASGWTTSKALLFYGFLAMALSVLVATFLGYPLGLLVLS